MEKTPTTARRTVAKSVEQPVSRRVGVPGVAMSNSEIFGQRASGSLKMVGKETFGTRTRIQFGTTIFEAVRPSETQLKKNIAAGRKAMKHLVEALPIVGVEIKRTPKVPLFHVDAQDPTVLIRDLDGEITRGTITKGVFKVLRKK